MDTKSAAMVDAKFEKHLSALLALAGDAGHGAIFAALDMLRNSYLAGRHNEFAKHCCDFTLLEGAIMSATTLRASEEAPARYIN